FAAMSVDFDGSDTLVIMPVVASNPKPKLLPVRDGLYHQIAQSPHVAPVAVHLDNARRSMPKGSLLPVPLICAVRFGAPLPLLPGEDKAGYLERAREAVRALAPATTW